MFFLILFFAVLVGLVFFSRWGEININNIQIDGNKIIDTQSIKKLIEEDMQGKYLWLFPKTNSFIYPEKKIRRDLAEKYKRLKEINIETNASDLKTIWVSVSEYEGKYLWCGQQLEENFLDQQCYFLDPKGYIFAEAPYFSGDVYFKFYGDPDIDSSNPIGFYFAPDYFSKLASFKEAIEKMNLKPVIFYQEDKEDGSLYLSCDNQIPNTPKIIFKLNSDYEKLAENLQSTITTEPLQTDLKNKLNDLLYLDLRFGNKIFYKFK